MTPGELLVSDGELELNAGRPTISIDVANTGDRPIQVGSHYHFAETNAALSFDRVAARGYRLNIAAGTAVRFEPGQRRTVELVALHDPRDFLAAAARAFHAVRPAQFFHVVVAFVLAAVPLNQGRKVKFLSRQGGLLNA